MKKFLFSILVFYLYLHSAFGQIGGETSYQLLNLPNSAKIASLGGINISLNEGDLNSVYYNPALLNSEMNDGLVLNYINYLADINFGYVAYANKTKFGTIGYGLHYINYGEFDRANEYGLIIGEFSANEFIFAASYAYQIDSTFSIGANLKPIFSFLDEYNSFAISSDYGLNMQSKDRLTSAALVVRNLGIPIKNYSPNNYEPLPFEILIGITKKLKHAPFRFSITARHLETFSLSYDLDDGIEYWGETSEKNLFQKVGDEVMRHMVFGLEMIPSKNVYLSFGYNHQRRMELGISDKMSTVGFSFGFGFKASKFSLAYGLAKYHLASSSHHISISTNLSNFTKRTGITGSNL